MQKSAGSKMIAGYLKCWPEVVISALSLSPPPFFFLPFLCFRGRKGQCLARWVGGFLCRAACWLIAVGLLVHTGTGSIFQASFSSQSGIFSPSLLPLTVRWVG